MQLYYVFIFIYIIIVIIRCLNGFYKDIEPPVINISLLGKVNIKFWFDNGKFRDRSSKSCDSGFAYPYYKCDPLININAVVTGNIRDQIEFFELKNKLQNELSQYSMSTRVRNKYKSRGFDISNTNNLYFENENNPISRKRFDFNSDIYFQIVGICTYIIDMDVVGFELLLRFCSFKHFPSIGRGDFIYGSNSETGSYAEFQMIPSCQFQYYSDSCWKKCQTVGHRNICNEFGDEVCMGKMPKRIWIINTSLNQNSIFIGQTIECVSDVNPQYMASHFFRILSDNFNVDVKRNNPNILFVPLLADIGLCMLECIFSFTFPDSRPKYNVSKEFILEIRWTNLYMAYTEKEYLCSKYIDEPIENAIQLSESVIKLVADVFILKISEIFPPNYCFIGFIIVLILPLLFIISTRKSVYQNHIEMDNVKIHQRNFNDRLLLYTDVVTENRFEELKHFEFALSRIGSSLTDDTIFKLY